MCLESGRILQTIGKWHSKREYIWNREFILMEDRFKPVLHNEFVNIQSRRERAEHTCIFVLPLGVEAFLTTHGSPGFSLLPVMWWGSAALLKLCFHLTDLIKVCFCATHLLTLLVLLFAETLAHVLAWLFMVENSCGTARNKFRPKKVEQKAPRGW